MDHGLSSRLKDVHCWKGGGLPHATIFYLDSLSQEQRSEPSHLCLRVKAAPVMTLAHSVCLHRVGGASARSAGMTHWLMSMKSMLSIYMFWLLTNRDCKFGGRIVYKSRL